MSELLIVISLFSALVIASLSPPITLWQDHQLNRRVDVIKSAVQFSKTQAIVLNERLKLMPLNEQDVWSKGMRLVRAQNPMSCIQSWHWSSSPIDVKWNGFHSKRYLTFEPDMLNGAMNGYFLIKSRSDKTLKILINRLGRIRVSSLIQ